MRWWNVLWYKLLQGLLSSSYKVSQVHTHLYSPVWQADIWHLSVFLPRCSGVAVVQKGDALSDTVCESVNTTASTAMNTVSTTSNTTPSHGWRTSTFVTSSVTEETPTYLTTSSPPSTVTDKKLGTVTKMLEFVKSNYCFNIYLFLPLCCISLSDSYSSRQCQCNIFGFDLHHYSGGLLETSMEER